MPPLPSLEEALDEPTAPATPVPFVEDEELVEAVAVPLSVSPDLLTLCVPVAAALSLTDDLAMPSEPAIPLMAVEMETCPPPPAGAEDEPGPWCPPANAGPARSARTLTVASRCFI